MDQASRTFLRKLSFPISFVGFIWIVHIVSVVFDLDMRRLGVYPHHLEGLAGILTTPLILGSWEHLCVNSVSFLILGAGLV